MASAVLTSYGRELDALSLTQPVLFGDWSYKVGTGGLLTPVDPDLTDLVTPVGAGFLGQVLTSGSTATATATTNGNVLVSGLVGMAGSPLGKWLCVATGALAGTWAVRSIPNSTSLVVYNPLFTGTAAVPTWEVRSKVAMQVSATASAFFVHLPKAVLSGIALGEVGIFGRILHAPAQAPLVGQQFLYAVAHHPAKYKHLDSVVNQYVTVQR